MNLYAPPGYGETLWAFCIGLAVFNLFCLILSIAWWARSDLRALRKDLRNPELYTVADQRQALRNIRDSYWYFESLPLFVGRSPIRLAMHRTSAPSLGPVLVVLALQSLPAISLFVGTWYAVHLGWHIAVYATKKVKAWTPVPVKRLLFTTWF
jgi:hypothetical protein